jgi:cytochrome c biogenesis protein
VRAGVAGVLCAWQPLVTPLACRLDHIYTTWYFLGLNALLAASLVACSNTTQWPSLQVARNWRLPRSVSAVDRLPVHATVPGASVLDLADALAESGYQAWVSRSGRLYASTGLIGKMAPLAVHASLLISMAGFLLSALGGHTGSAMVPEGSSFVIRDALKPVSPLADLLLPRSADDVVEVDGFRVTYYPNGQVSQFYSDLGVVDTRSGRRVQAAEMKVNVPLRHGGVTAYQTDWSMAAATVRLGARGGDAASAADGQQVALPMASLEGKPGFSGRIWGTFIPVPPLPDTAQASSAPRGVTLVARDFQSVALYGPDGSFAGVRRPGSGTPIVVDGVPMLVERLTGATGLELKHDPGVPVVYAGFAGVMLTTFLSFVSHSQVWAMEDGATGALHVGGKSTKLQDAFEKQLMALLRTLPEYEPEPEPR